MVTLPCDTTLASATDAVVLALEDKLRATCTCDVNTNGGEDITPSALASALPPSLAAVVASAIPTLSHFWGLANAPHCEEGSGTVAIAFRELQLSGMLRLRRR